MPAGSGAPTLAMPGGRRPRRRWRDRQETRRRRCWRRRWCGRHTASATASTSLRKSIRPVRSTHTRSETATKSLIQSLLALLGRFSRNLDYCAMTRALPLQLLLHGRIDVRNSTAFESTNGDTGRTGTHSVSGDQPAISASRQTRTGREAYDQFVRKVFSERAQVPRRPTRPERRSFEEDADRIRQYHRLATRLRRGKAWRYSRAPERNSLKPFRSKRLSMTTGYSSALCRTSIRWPS